MLRVLEKIELESESMDIFHRSQLGMSPFRLMSNLLHGKEVIVRDLKEDHKFK
jgi:hypothetical protein